CALLHFGYRKDRFSFVLKYIFFVQKRPALNFTDQTPDALQNLELCEWIFVRVERCRPLSSSCNCYARLVSQENTSTMTAHFRVPSAIDVADTVHVLSPSYRPSVNR